LDHSRGEMKFKKAKGGEGGVTDVRERANHFNRGGSESLAGDESKRKRAQMTTTIKVPGLAVSVMQVWHFQQR